MTSPVARFLDSLKEKKWSPESTDAALQPDEQVKTHAWLQAAIRQFANTGEFAHMGNWNSLVNGIWEIKRWQIRISFFDTDGLGNYAPKITERMHTGGGGYFPLPEFDEYIRLGTAFAKETQKTPQRELDLAQLVRKEDLAHDKQ